MRRRPSLRTRLSVLVGVPLVVLLVAIAFAIRAQLERQADLRSLQRETIVAGAVADLGDALHQETSLSLAIDTDRGSDLDRVNNARDITDRALADLRSLTEAQNDRLISTEIGLALERIDDLGTVRGAHRPGPAELQ